MRTFGAQLDQGSGGWGWGPRGKRRAGDRRQGHLGPRSGGRQLPRPRWGGPGEELGGSTPRGGAGAGSERTGRGGPGTLGGAGPHTGRGGWLGPLRSRRRLEEEARRLKKEGRRRRPRLELAADSLPGLSRERYRAPALWPRPPARGPHWGGRQGLRPPREG